MDGRWCRAVPPQRKELCHDQQRRCQVFRGVCRCQTRLAPLKFMGGLGPGMWHPGCEIADTQEAGHVVDA